VTPADPVAGDSRSLAVALLVALRPRQWLKNVLVFAAPLAAGDVLQLDILLPSIGAFIVFSLMSSATYLVNDIRDRGTDREHPTKQFRPIAAGELPVGLAWAVAALLAAAALLIAAGISVGLLGVVAAYAVFTLSYSLYLKHEPVIELVILALGFLLRAIAGGVASDLPISQWFLIVAGFGSLFMAAGKRYSELVRVEADDGGAVGRRSLAGYTPGFLRFVWAISAAVAITAYCLWAFEIGINPTSVPWAAWSIVPFVVAILRYAKDVDRGAAEAPEDVVLHDPFLLGTGLVWLVLFALGALGV
jgi:decaprenyl-phosphate phosphoribosyltransferase